MSEHTNGFDAKDALSAVGEIARSAAARAGKGKKLKPEDQRLVIESLGQLLLRSTLPLTDIAQGARIPPTLYAATLGEVWVKMSPDRRNDAVQWIEGLPKGEGHVIRRFLIPSIATQDPRSARFILPVKPKGLDTGDDRETFARNWLAQDIGPFQALLAGDLVEYQVTRVLSLLLLMAGAPSVRDDVKSQAIRMTAQALEDHNLAKVRAGTETIFNSLAQLTAALPFAASSAVKDHLCDHVPSVASRLGLTVIREKSEANTTIAQDNRPPDQISETQVGLPETQTPELESEATNEAPDLDQPGSPAQSGESVQPAEGQRKTSLPIAMDHDGGLIVALETRAREQRDSALILEQAASRFKAAVATIAAFEATSASVERAGEARQRNQEAMERRIESLSRDLTSKDNDLRARTEELRSREEAIQNLERSNNRLSSQLSEARNLASAVHSRLDTMAASHKSEMETLVHRVAGQTDQQLEEFRKGLARTISMILRGTPSPDSVAPIDGKVILFRLWEIIEALKRKSIPVRTD